MIDGEDWTIGMDGGVSWRRRRREEFPDQCARTRARGLVAGADMTLIVLDARTGERVTIVVGASRGDHLSEGLVCETGAVLT